jgi:LacI family transcriptional regulator, galactose operon repressor
MPPRRPTKATERQRPSVYDVAERAGVSIATVSRVLRDSAPVAVETRRRVLAAVDELRWRPSRLARAFVAQNHGAVGIVFPDLGGPYYSRVIAGFEERAAERRTAVLILATHGRGNAGELVSELADRVDGLIVMGRTVSDAAVAEIAAADVPIVLLARPPVGDVASVRAANTAPAADLAAHVLAHGRRDIVFVGDPAGSPDVSDRWRGVRRTLRRAGVDADRALVPCDGLDVEHGYKAGIDLFATGHRVDAVMCANDEVAAGIYRAAAACELRVPADIVVTGWDDNPMAARFHPPLTTVRQPMHELGARAAALLFARIDARPAPSTVLRTSVVLRESCGCAGLGGAREAAGLGGAQEAAGLGGAQQAQTHPSPDTRGSR